ncbi:hypothetical protein PRIPAC_95345 [Pristionchus pacificus]|uniref:Uncharacterized protein n=1 Tax=Pristionchus pacificus TaxID=54126 RepID=A0A2A6BDM2_PRIPA|nr:hypothetical protein PRIPAC_95345 [Pristionchus pacificus]|eukprot:PDM63946.1 hypothetical protein PRIPAC_49447 [Pristionchus pacificus]
MTHFLCCLSRLAIQCALLPLTAIRRFWRGRTATQRQSITPIIFAFFVILTLSSLSLSCHDAPERVVAGRNCVMNEYCNVSRSDGIEEFLSERRTEAIEENRFISFEWCEWQNSSQGLPRTCPTKLGSRGSTSQKKGRFHMGTPLSTVAT